jgi:hypothetical protein
MYFLDILHVLLYIRFIPEGVLITAHGPDGERDSPGHEIASVTKKEERD